MATTFNSNNSVLKASELVKVIPAIASFIDTKDWIHVVISHDSVKNMTFIASYIWDTRCITRAGLFADEEEAITALNSLTEEELEPLKANDNKTCIRIMNSEDQDWYDYVGHINHEVMTELTKVSFKCSTDKSNPDDIHKYYSINGTQVCTTHKYLLAQDTTWHRETTWNKEALMSLFGFGVPEFYEDTFKDSTDSRLSKTDIKYKLANSFHITF
jgi:hypothetical protein